MDRPLSKQPIPENAKLIHKGVIFDVYQWEQEMFDGTKKTFEKVKRVDTVGVIPVIDGKLVLTRQKQPGSKDFIGCLGGRIDEGESPIDAIKRELLEESGYTAKTLDLWFSTQLIEKLDWAIYTFIAKDCVKVKEPELDSGEKIELIYLSIDKFIDIATQENFRDAEISLEVFQTIKNEEKMNNFKKKLIG